VGILNGSFVPVYLVIEDYEPAGKSSAAEKAEFARICGDISDAKKGIMFISHPNGQTIETLISSPAITVERVRTVLESAAASIGTRPGAPLGERQPQAPRPETPKGGLVLHLAARYLPKSDTGWAQMAVEDWIVLEPADCQKLAGKMAIGEKWDIDRQVAGKLLKYFYPPSLNFYPDNGRLDKQDLTAKVISVKDGIALVRLDGVLKMKRSFTFAKEDKLFVEADIVGYAEFDVGSKQIRSLQIVTDKGTYAKASFGIAVTSAP
jgi:hypothetical protein